ncbi:MAG TPA: pyridoxamine 5'-phosphate oxidase family protein [Acidimicrobiales bacterium]|nr:pyridoxamine 5'-phosphate oxidase family protein [Acidimicrobiales bacterium]
MASWDEFARRAPDVARAGERLLTQFGPGLGFLATVDRAGAPRLHPICPVVADGELWAFVITASPKCADLRRDGRYALHSFPPEEVDDEFVVRGAAAEASDLAFGDRQWERIRAATTAAVGREHETPFRLGIDRAMVAAYEARGVFPPTYSTWRA